MSNIYWRWGHHRYGFWTIGNWNRHRLNGTAIEGRHIRPRGDSEARLLSILRAGGEVRIRIHTASTTYVIDSFNANGFDHAFRSLQQN